jgi:hypothetical protein
MLKTLAVSRVARQIKQEWPQVVKNLQLDAWGQSILAYNLYQVMGDLAPAWKAKNRRWCRELSEEG